LFFQAEVGIRDFHVTGVQTCALPIYKGLAFVFVTSLMLYVLINNNLKKIKESEEKYRLLAENSKDLIYLIKPDSEIEYISPSVKDLLGYNENDVIGRKKYDFIHPDDLNNVQNGIKELLAGGTSKSPFKYRVKNAFNEYVWFESAKQAVKKNNEVTGILSSCRNITER